MRRVGGISADTVQRVRGSSVRLINETALFKRMHQLQGRSEQ